MTDLSIIIVCYKGWDRLNKCLDALNLFSRNNFSCEVIIVDNKSDDEAIFKIKDSFPKFKFIYNEINGGFANGCNLGAKNASGEFILFLNPDTLATENEIEKLLNIAKQNPDYSIISCRQVNEHGKECISTGPFPALMNLTGFQRAVFRNLIPHPAFAKATAGKASHHTPDITYPDWVSGSVVMIRHDTFEKIDGFDEDFWMYFEDVDLCKRIRNSKGEIAFCSDITIEHNHGGSSRINLSTTSVTKTEVHISRHVYISKHKTGIEKLAIQTFLVINNLISGAIMALLGILLFYIPKVFSCTLIFFRLIGYYTRSIVRFSWISPRSANLKKT
jgi:GT2 family glycosyltransferase